MTPEGLINAFKQGRGGFVTLAVTLAATLTLGVVDQFTTRVIPWIAQAIEDSLNPPKFFIGFAPPVEVSGGVNILNLGTGTQVQVQQSNLGDPVLTVLAGPGTYHLQLHGVGEKLKKNLIDVLEITKANQFWKVDTSDRFWIDRRDADKSETAGTETAGTTAGSNNDNSPRYFRLSPLNSDFEIAAAVKEPVLRAILLTALGEVGVFERGTDWDRGRIASYWAATDAKHLSKGTPWILAFVVWVVARADVQPPKNGALYSPAWTKWGDEVPDNEVLPGAIALFRGSNYERSGIVRVEIVLQKRPNCIEVVVGDKGGHVAILCSEAELVSIRRPQTQPAETAKTSQE